MFLGLEHMRFSPPNSTLSVLSVLIAIISMGIYAYLVALADRYEREPIKLLFLALVWGGVFAAGMAFFLEILFAVLIGVFPPPVRWLLEVSVGAPIFEEFAKGLFLLILYTRWRYELDGVIDGLVYGAMLGFGFSATENLLYFNQGLGKGMLVWVSLVFWRQFVFGLNHAFYTSFTGLGLGLARWGTGRWRYIFPPLGFALAVGAHAVHNTLVSSPFGAIGALGAWLFSAGGILIVLLIWALSLRKERKIIEEQLRSEVGSLIPEKTYLALVEDLSRLKPHIVRTSGKIDRRLRDLLVELAMKKYQSKQMTSPEDRRELSRRLAQLRAEIATLQEQGKEPQQPPLNEEMST